ncbi:MAG: response regulator [Deltaproteobacteria bacterium]|nr:response regulator [Candidatus Desulfobacula maris]
MDKRIIVIDDQIDIRNAFELALEDTGIDVATAESGRAGLKRIQENSYDLVYLDLKMPGMNGIETLHAIRKMNPTIPVYIITAFHGEFMDGLLEAQQKGYEFELLKKPLEMDEIRQITVGILNGPTSY